MKTSFLQAALLGLLAIGTRVHAYNDLWIPPTLTGTNFNLSLDVGSRSFATGKRTTTYSYNGSGFWGPTLIMNKGDVVHLHVTNNLIDTTTTHWHGFHIPAIMDGGPHQTIPPGTTWHPSFVVQNNAATYWYHPHLHEKTQEQLTRGAGGMIIIRDEQESALALPRTYGVDDIPLTLTSRRFTTNGTAMEFVTVNSAYGDYLLANGVLDAQVSLPAQQVRLRILNAEIERSFNLGFGDNRTFHVIATDGGLVDAPVAVTRVHLAVGERVEVLVDLGNDAVGSGLDLKAYNTGQARDFPGGEPARTGQFGSLLNNTTFNLLHINVAARTTNPILTRPAVLTTNVFWTANSVSNSRTIRITGGFPGSATPLFTFDNISFSPTVFNQTVDYNAVERWTIVNNSGFSHSFHIHDIQFNLVSRTGGTGSIANYEQGWKDTLFIAQNSSVSFLARFDGFASNANPFMYHCHFSNHEDEGLMGQFLVVNHAVEDLAIASFTRIGSDRNILMGFRSTPGTTYSLQYSKDLTTGSWSDIGSVTSDGRSASFTETDASRLSDSRGFYRVRIPTIP
jgi:bilirubin oxidase